MLLLEIDPNVVKPGWTPLLITIGIGLVIVLLFFSMRRQFSRIDVSQSQPGVTDPQAEALRSEGDEAEVDDGAGSVREEAAATTPRTKGPAAPDA